MNISFALSPPHSFSPRVPFLPSLLHSLTFFLCHPRLLLFSLPGCYTPLTFCRMKNLNNYYILLVGRAAAATALIQFTTAIVSMAIPRQCTMRPHARNNIALYLVSATHTYTIPVTRHRVAICNLILGAKHRNKSLLLAKWKN